MTAKTHVIRYESIQEPLDEEERELMDPDTWDWENPIEVVTGPGGVRWVFEVPLEEDDLSEIEPAAHAKGMTVIAFLKDAALQVARQSNTKQRQAS